MLASQWPTDAPLIILDEIHKYSKWKTLIKGNYDKFRKEHKFLVTGSARLDVYRKGGDSLQGRYHHYRLHPFTYAECCQLKIKPYEIFAELNCDDSDNRKELEALYYFGGFPEPLIAQNPRDLRRWHKEKLERLFREDIRDMESIRDISSMELLRDLLPEKVGSPFSINSIREDLEVSHKAVTHWMKILESFYYQYRIYPFTSRKFRSLKKEPKLYLWDWSEVVNEGARFENCVVSHLLKFVHFLQDHGGYDAQLCYLRDREKREVDFLVVVGGKPWFACEAKVNDTMISPHLRYFNERLNIPFCYQVNRDGKEDYKWQYSCNAGLQIFFCIDLDPRPVHKESIFMQLWDKLHHMKHRSRRLQFLQIVRLSGFIVILALVLRVVNAPRWGCAKAPVRRIITRSTSFDVAFDIIQ